MNRLRQIVLVLALILLITSCVSGSDIPTSTTTVLTIAPSSTPYPTATYSQALLTAVASGECIQSFDTFAYQGPLFPSQEKTTPLPPWQIEATMPIQQVEGYRNFHAEIARSIDGHQEIWLSQYAQTQPDDTILVIYQPESREWEIISSRIENTDLFVRDLFVTRDGVVWGKVIWNYRNEQLTLESIPVLSRYNESTRHFELAQGVLEIPLVIGQHYFGWPEIVLDAQDVFWIFVYNDGIYSYNSAAQTTQKHADLPEGFEVTSTALSPDGSIYFEKYRYAGEMWYRLPEDVLFQFVPETGEIVPVDIPDEEWPVFSGMLVDRTGNLWLGSIGYREPDGTWHLIHPHPEEYFDHLGQHLWATPFPMLESSNGILWYQKLLDTSGWAEGTAWYDPETGEGCLFTNQPANIIEDSAQQLWLVADGILYKYPLNP